MATRNTDMLLQEISQCRLCESELADGVRPVLQFNPQARILVAGQAPGRKVHESGVPFDDASGNRLRDWMGLTRDQFYDDALVAILPMGFCYPGTGKSGDLPPRPECAATWRQELLDRLVDVRLTLLIGDYAQAWHLPARGKNLTETVRHWRDYSAGDSLILPLPHPSPRNNIWLKKNPWFADEVLPVLREAIRKAIT